MIPVMAPMPLRVVFVSSGLMASSGGAPVSEMGLATALLHHHQVTVLCRQQRYEADFVRRTALGCRVIEYSLMDVCWLAAGTGKLRSLFDECDVLHINGHWRWENTVFAMRAQRLHKPIVLHPRGMMAVAHRNVWAKKIFNLVLGNYLMRRAAAIIGLSHYECRHFFSLPIDPARVEVIPNGIELGGMAAQPVLDRGDYFLYFGRLEARKNLLFLIEAFGKYAASGGTQRLVLMGPVERRYDLKVYESATHYKVADRIEIIPPQYHGEKASIIQRALAVVYPAIDEAFGRVPFESIAMGTPPIISSESGAAEYLRALLPESVYEANDTMSLSRVLKRHESGHTDVSKLLAAREWINLELNWSVVSVKVESLYQRVVDRKPGGFLKENVPNGKVSELSASG